MLEYTGVIGEEMHQTAAVKSTPRRWTEEEIEWSLEKREEGYTYAEIADALGRTLVSVSIKLKRAQKDPSDNSYNEAHLDDKYGSNEVFIRRVGDVKTVLDVYCGVNSYWKSNYEDLKVTTNDIDKSVDADYHLDAFKLLCKLYFEGKSYDIVDLDPFGSAYDSFDLAVKMAKKGLVITFGEIGHKRWKRLDFVSKRYPIETLEDFTIENLISEVVRIGKQNKKTLTPILVRNYKNISRVYFEISDYKETSQWEGK